VKIGIVGGTGGIGEGMALRLSPMHEVFVGSRTADKAVACCDGCLRRLENGRISCTLRGVSNQEAVDNGDIVILAIPYGHLVTTLTSLTGFEGKIVISPVNPIKKEDYFSFDPPPEGSAAMLAERLLPAETRVVAAFNNIAANSWKNLDEDLDYSVAVCGDDPDAKRLVMKFIDSISHLKALDAGPLASASMVESITPLLLNIARYNGMKDVGVRFG